VRQRHAENGKVSPRSVPELELTRFAKTDRGDDRLRPKLRFVIAVPAHTVAFVPVEVEQHAVERRAGQRLDLVPQLQQCWRPMRWPQKTSGVAVVGPRIAMPCDQAGLRMTLAPHENLFLAPRRIRTQLAETARRISAQGIGKVNEIRIRE